VDVHALRLEEAVVLALLQQRLQTVKPMAPAKRVKKASKRSTTEARA
jgi:hypothetical protein